MINLLLTLSNMKGGDDEYAYDDYEASGADDSYGAPPSDSYGGNTAILKYL
jgi:hypothetical protein